MDELDILFDEIITFEEEIKNNDTKNCCYPDKEKAKRTFHDYIEWRFNQIQPRIVNYSDRA